MLYHRALRGIYLQYPFLACEFTNLAKTSSHINLSIIFVRPKFSKISIWAIDEYNSSYEDDGYGGSNSVISFYGKNSLQSDKKNKKKLIQSSFNPKVYFKGQYFSENSFQANNSNNQPNIIAVSKTFKLDHIIHLINHGHTHYGENKVQEAVEKWEKVKKENNNIKLHLIGKLQTNKVKFAVKIFDYIHSLSIHKAHPVFQNNFGNSIYSYQLFFKFTFIHLKF